MHGLINRSIEGFLRDSYGEVVWRDVAEGAGADPRGFQTMCDAADDVTDALIVQASAMLHKAPSELLEDLGAWLARHEPIRRLLRFSGRNFQEFLHRLEELPGRAHLVVPGLAMPDLDVTQAADDWLVISLAEGGERWGAVIAGVIRVMADDYGALVIMARLV